MPPRDFVREVVERLILLERATECGACLHARVSRILDRAEGIHCLEIAVSQISINVTMKLV